MQNAECKMQNKGVPCGTILNMERSFFFILHSSLSILHSTNKMTLDDSILNRQGSFLFNFCIQHRH